MLGIYDVYKGPGNIEPVLPGAAQFPISDPFTVIAAMASVTKSLSFGITASTTYEQPFILARRFSTLDHLTKGRVGWNIVTSYLESAAKNLGLDTQVPHDERYKIAEEFLDVSYKLWEGSWRDGAVVEDLATEQYTVPRRVRRINHQGFVSPLINRRCLLLLHLDVHELTNWQKILLRRWSTHSRTILTTHTIHLPSRQQ